LRVGNRDSGQQAADTSEFDEILKRCFPKLQLISVGFANAVGVTKQALLAWQTPPTRQTAGRFTLFVTSRNDRWTFSELALQLV
jgi:hypothetical protein